MQRDPYDPDDNEVSGVVDVVEPLHSGQSPALPVISREDRERQEREHLQRPVEFVEKYEIHCRVYEGPDDDVEGLTFEIPPVRVQEEGAHHRDARPVRRERYNADQDCRQYLSPLRDVIAPADEDQHGRPGERPHDARLIEYSGGEGKKGYPEGEIVREMRDDGEYEEPYGVFLSVVSVVAAFGDEEPHNRRRQSADDVKGNDVPHRLSSRKESPCQVIDSHRDDRDELQHITGEAGSLFFYRCVHSRSLSFQKIVAELRGFSGQFGHLGYEPFGVAVFLQNDRTCFFVEQTQ